MAFHHRLYVVPLFIAVGTSIGLTAQAGDIVLTLEEPLTNTTYTGVGNLRGWVVGSAGMSRVELFMDDEAQATIPLGGRRSDVGARYPQYPDSYNSGFSMAYNYSSLQAGPHNIVVRAFDKSGSFKEASSLFNVVRFDNDFISDSSSVNLSQAVVSHDNHSLTIKNLIADGKSYDIVLDWRTATQSYEITRVNFEGGGNGTEPNSIETIINDMKLPHEGELPQQIRDWWSWGKHPVLHSGSNPGSFTAMTLWGNLYEDQKYPGNQATNARVHLKNAKSYMLSKRDNRWHLLQSDIRVYGGLYDFINNKQENAIIRNENDGGISVTADGLYCFHFWVNRATIDPTDIAGIFTTIQARLIIDDPNKPDDRDLARYILNMGADYWRDMVVNAVDTACEKALDAKSDQNNCSVGHGRFKYASNEWKSFNMITISEEEVRNNPPPLD